MVRADWPASRSGSDGRQLPGLWPGAPGRLSFVRRARDLGFSLDQVRELLRLSDQTDRPCEDIDLIGRGHLAEVERKVADLTALGHELRQIIGQCGHGTVAECRIIEALSPA